MGISGLLPLLKSIQKPVHISALAGQCVAVDAYVWLHRGIYGCATEIGMSKPTRKHVDYCMHRVRLLRHYGVTPLLVFDGAPLPAKAITEQERALRRKEGLEKAKQYQKNGQSRLAFEYFQRSLDVTPSIARQLIEALRKENIKYVVAPYEADAQLAYLSRTGVVAAVITEDSDLLVFGCPRVIFKMDQYGYGMEINRIDLSSNSGISLHGWSDADFRRWCILAGCDYLKSLPGMGLKRAHKYAKMYKTLEQMLDGVKKDGFPVTDVYRNSFKEAELTFLHQRVYDITTQQLLHLTDLPSSLIIDDISYLGGDLDKNLARAIAIGDTDPITRKPFNLDSIIPTKSATSPKCFLTTRGSPCKSTGFLQLSKTLSPKKPAAKTEIVTSNASFGSKTTQKIIRKSSLSYAQESTITKPTILSQLRAKSTTLFQRRLPQRTLPDEGITTKTETESIPVLKTTTTSPYFTTASSNGDGNNKKKPLTLLRTLSVEEFLACANTAITASPSTTCTSLSSPIKLASGTPSLETDLLSSASSAANYSTTILPSLINSSVKSTTSLPSHGTNKSKSTEYTTLVTPKHASFTDPSKTPPITDTTGDKENTPSSAHEESPSVSLSPSVQRQHHITSTLNSTGKSIVTRKPILIQANAITTAAINLKTGTSSTVACVNSRKRALSIEIDDNYGTTPSKISTGYSLNRVVGTSSHQTVSSHIQPINDVDNPLLLSQSVSSTQDNDKSSPPSSPIY